MLEKSSRINLTVDQLANIQKGIITSDVLHKYDLTASELLDIIKYQQYNLIGETTNG